MRKAIVALLVACAVLSPALALAQGVATGDTVTIEKAKVTAVSAASTSPIEGTGTSEQVQTLTAQVLDGAQSGHSVSFENDYVLLNVGDVFYLRHTENSLDGTDMYSVSDPYRLNVLAGLALLFLVLLLVFGGLQGLRALATLLGSLVLIFFALIPGILHGYSPTLVGLGVAGVIIVVGSYMTHGFNRATSAAVLGMLASVLLAGAIGYAAIHMGHLSGFASEEASELNFSMQGGLDAVGLLFAGIMIGLLGILYDIAIGQAVAIEELFAAATTASSTGGSPDLSHSERIRGLHMTRKQIYRRGIRIGREHIGALVNTLAILYVGAALPLFLLVQSSTYGFLFAINSELFATEIIRILVGAIGLILAVPITTLIATYMLTPAEKSAG